jgi:peptide/nickel transport system substrate-binding protein
MAGNRHGSRRRKAAALLVGASLAIIGPVAQTAAPAAAAPAGEREDRERRTLTVALLKGVDSLNPFLGVFASSTQLNRLTYDTLTGFSTRDGSPVPALAQSWKTSADGLVWTFTIRPGARWSDGHALTSADVAFTYKLMLRNPAARTAKGSLVKTFTSVTAPDPRTVVIKTTVPTATMLALDIPIVPEHVWKGVARIDTFQNDRFPLVGSGPFQLVERQVDQYYRFTANEHYRGGAPKVDEVVFRYFKNTEAAVLALRKGEVDFAGGLTAAQFDSLEQDGNISRNEARLSRFIELAFNPGAARTDGSPVGDGHPALRDQRVRRAIDHAIDRKTLVSRVLGDHGEAGEGYLPPTLADWRWKPDRAARRAFDLAAANRILDRAGYRRGADGVRTMPGNGRKLEFRLFVPVGTPMFEQTAPYLERWLRQAGIRVRTQLMADTRLSDVTGEGEYDMFLGGWSTGPDPDYVLSVQTCAARPGPGASGGALDAFHCDQNYDRLYQRQSREVDRATRSAAVKEMQRRMYQTAAQVILFYPASLEGYRSDRFTRVARHPADRGSIVDTRALVLAAPVTASTREGQQRAIAPVTSLGVMLAVLTLGGVLAVRRRSGRDERE